MLIVQTHATSLGALDAEICKLNQILVKAPEHAGPVQVVKLRKAKLKTWTTKIKQAVQRKGRPLRNGSYPIDLMILAIP